MIDPTLLESLITKLEGAPEGSRELDAEIAVALGHDIQWLPIGDIKGAAGGPVIVKWRVSRRREPCPAFTSSLDDGMLLVPDGWLWTVSTYWSQYDPKLPYFADVMPPWVKDPNDPRELPDTQSWAHTAPLALCIAALKAMREACR